MTLGSWEDRGRTKRRRRVFGRLFVLALLVGAIAIAGTWSYDIGTTLARQDVTLLERQVAELSEQNDALRNERVGLDVEINAIRERERRLLAAAPNEQERAMLALIRAREEAGVDPERIKFVIEAVSNVRECDLEPVTRRFIANTEVRTGSNDTVSFASNTVAVTAIGTAAKDAEGKPLGWFDPALPIKAAFTNIDGSSTVAEGVLPLQHSVVVRDQEYRFNLVAGERSFIAVTADRCQYP